MSLPTLQWIAFLVLIILITSASLGVLGAS